MAGRLGPEGWPAAIGIVVRVGSKPTSRLRDLAACGLLTSEEVRGFSTEESDA
jgi:hypothetical protein